MAVLRRLVSKWPVAVIVLGAVATLAWTIFLVWEAAAIVAAVI